MAQAEYCAVHALAEGAQPWATHTLDSEPISEGKWIINTHSM